MKNHQARPTDSTELPEVNVTSNVKVTVGNTCRTSRHFVDLYQASLKKKGKYIETNFIDNFNDDEPNPNVRFDSSDFFDDVEDVDIKSILGNSEDECLVDSGTTNTVLKNIKYFYEFHIANVNVNTICGTSNLIESSGKAHIVLPKELPSSAWGHAILHAAALIRLRPSASHKYSPLQLVSRREPSLSHLKVFGCGVYVPISPPQPRFADCQFKETMFPILGGENKKLDKKDVTWNASKISFLDPRSGQSLNAPSRIDIPETPDESNVRRMHGRPMGSKDTNPQKKKEHNTTGKVQEVVINKIPNEINNNTEYVDKSLEDVHIPSEYEISINFVQNGTTWNRNETRVDEIFAYAIASDNK
ncbi:retrovirus-related pol polyprotein from transposon TNT 1-94 [Tanacetum coccineum]